MNKIQRGLEIQNAIRSVLVTDWNPIGFSVPGDEYDAYIGTIYRLIANQADDEEIARHLHEIVIESLGLNSSGPNDHIDVARKLQAMNVRL